MKFLILAAMFLFMLPVDAEAACGQGRRQARQERRVERRQRLFTPFDGTGSVRTWIANRRSR